MMAIEQKKRDHEVSPKRQWHSYRQKKYRSLDNLSPDGENHRKRGSFKRMVTSSKKRKEEYQSVDTVSPPSMPYYYYDEESQPKSTKLQLEDSPQRTPPILLYEPDYDTSGLLTELTGCNDLNHEIYESNYNIATMQNSRSEMDISEDLKQPNHSLRTDSKKIATSIIGSLFIQNQSQISTGDFIWTDIIVLITVFISVQAIRIVSHEGKGLGIISQWICSICSVIFALYLRIQKQKMHNLINDKKNLEEQKRIVINLLKDENSQLHDEFIGLKAKQFRKKIIKQRFQEFVGNRTQMNSSMIITMVKTLKKRRLEIKERLRGHILKTIMKSILLGNPKTQVSNIIDESKSRPLIMNRIALSLLQFKLKSMKLITLKESLLIYILNRYGNSIHTVFRIVCANVLSNSLPTNHRIFIIPENIENCRE